MFHRVSLLIAVLAGLASAQERVLESNGIHVFPDGIEGSVFPVSSPACGAQNVLFIASNGSLACDTDLTWDATNNRLYLDGGASPNLLIGDGSGNAALGANLVGGTTPHLDFGGTNPYVLLKDSGNQPSLMLTGGDEARELIDSTSSDPLYRRTVGNIYEWSTTTPDGSQVSCDGGSPLCLNLLGLTGSGGTGCTASRCYGFSSATPYGGARLSVNTGGLPNANTPACGACGFLGGFGEVAGFSTGGEPGIIFGVGYDNLNQPILNILGSYSRFYSRAYTGPRLGYLTDATDPFMGSLFMVAADSVGTGLTGPMASFRWDTPTIENPDRFADNAKLTLAWADCGGSGTTRNVCTNSQFLGGQTCSTGSICKASGIACANDADCGGAAGSCRTASGAHRPWWGAFDQAVVAGTTKTGGGCNAGGCTAFRREGCGNGAGDTSPAVCSNNGTTVCSNNTICGAGNYCLNRGHVGGTTYYISHAFVDNQSGTPLVATSYTDPFTGETNCPECELQRAGRTADGRQSAITRVGGTTDCASGYCKLLATLPTLCYAGATATENKCSIDGASCATTTQGTDCAMATKGDNFCVARRKTCTNDASCGAGGYCDWYPSGGVIDEVMFYSTVTGLTDATITQQDRARFETGHMPRACAADSDCGGGTGSCTSGESEGHRNGVCKMAWLYAMNPASSQPSGTGISPEGQQPWNVNTTTPPAVSIIGKDDVQPNLVITPNTNPQALVVTDSSRSQTYPFSVDPSGGVVIGTGTKITKHLSGTLANVVSANIPALTCAAYGAVTGITGAAVGDTASATPIAVAGGIETVNLSWNAYVSGADTVTIRACNPTAGGINTADTQTWRADVWQH